MSQLFDPISSFVVGNGILIVAAVVSLVLAGLVWRFFTRGPSKASIIADVNRKERERTYRQASRDLSAARDALTKRGSHRKAILIDLICDLGDQWQDRDAPRLISYEQAIQALQQIQPLLEMRKDTFIPGLGKRNLPELIIILHTFGGYSQSVQMIANAIAQYEGSKTAYVPYIAMSGGTKIALACDKIVMGASAALGPIDTQYNGFPKVDLLRLRGDDKLPSIPAGVLLTQYEAEKFDQFAIEHAEQIVNPKHVKSKDDNPAVRLSSGDWSHNRSIFPDVAKSELGLNVEIGCRKVMKYVDARIRMIDTRIEREARGASGDAGDEGDKPTPNELPKLTVIG